ncbi:26S proteasome regulatory subunit 10B -like protein A [Cardamine amara subsp. amara]|uniref:26S proteasome regulatory subunit 10B -like protein A n=1 Tax=Cardamine amara subsp. amara TaxID=228776 RepID=A0ABD0Z3W3_CARAN
MEDIEEERRRLVIEIYKNELQIRKRQKLLDTLTEIYLEALKKKFKETEDDLKYLNFTRAETIGEIVKPLSKDRFIVKGDDGARYIVNCCSKVDKSKLISGTRVAQERKSLTIMRILPPMVNPLVYNMVYQHSDDVSYSDLGGLSKQIKDLRDYIELPLTKPELFERVGVKPPKGVLLYGPPGTGKTLLAKAIANNTNSTFLAVVSSALLRKYLGDSSLLVREMFKYARDHQPCIIFMDEIDAIGRRRSSEGEGKNNVCNRVLIELLSQLDGFNELDKVKVIMATNRPDVLDSALIRPGRIDKKIEIPLPNQDSRMRILKIHASGITKHGEIDYEKVVKLSEGFNGADMRNICTEAGMFALRAERDYVVPNDFIKAVTKLVEAKKLESSSQYSVDF